MHNFIESQSLIFPYNLSHPFDIFVMWSNVSMGKTFWYPIAALKTASLKLRFLVHLTTKRTVILDGCKLIKSFLDRTVFLANMWLHKVPDKYWFGSIRFDPILFWFVSILVWFFSLVSVPILSNSQFVCLFFFFSNSRLRIFDFD